LWVILIFIVTNSAHANIDRPMEGEGATTVYVSLFLVDVDRVDTAEQSFDANVYMQFRWHDPRQAHGGDKKVLKQLNDVWHPRIQMVNRQKVWTTLPEIVEISPDGEVLYRQRVWGTFSQPLQLRTFPFDTQVFTIQLASVGYTPEELALVSDPETNNGISESFSVADWRIFSWNIDVGLFRLAREMKGMAGVALSFEAEREAGYFVVKIIIPLILIVAMSYVVFWIDPTEAGTQISVAITAMLTLIAYRFAIGTALPKVSYLTRLDYFILVSTILIFATLIAVVITSRLAKSDKLSQARKIDRGARWIFPVLFVVVALETLVFRIVL
jgi:hypothetical protein